MSDWKDPEIEAVRAILASRRPQAGAPPPSLEQRRAGSDMAWQLGTTPDGISREDVVLGGVTGERSTPANAVAGRAVLYMHGGGFSVGSPMGRRSVAGRLGHHGRAPVTALKYSRAPESVFPQALNDVMAAYQALLESGIAPAGVVLAGDSAGGGLAVGACLACKARGLPMPAGIVALSPWADLTNSHETYQTRAGADPMLSKPMMDSAAAGYLAGADGRDPLASPVFGDFAGLPPMLLQVGSDEVVLGDSLMLAASAGAARVEVRLEVWPEMVHVWHQYTASLDAARRALTGAGAWIDERLS